MNVTVKVGETPRVYVERIDITGNTTTRDKVIRREFRLNEGDAFNALKVKRSQDRIQSLGFFQDKLEIKQTEGSAPDRVVLGVDVEEKPTGPAVAVGRLFEPREVRRPALGGAEQFHGQGPGSSTPRSIIRPIRSRSSWASPTRISSTSRSCSAANFSAAITTASIIVGNDRNTTYSQLSTGGGLQAGLPAHRILDIRRRATRCIQDKVSLDKATFYTDDGTVRCRNAIPQGRPLSVRRDRNRADLRRSAIRPSTTTPTAFTRRAASASPCRQDFAGLGGDVDIFESRVDATKYQSASAAAGSSRLHGEGGYIKALQQRAAVRPRSDSPDRPLLRSAAARLRHPRHRSAHPVRIPYNDGRHARPTRRQSTDRPMRSAARLITWAGSNSRFPTSFGFAELGLRPSAFIDVGSLWDMTRRC